ncbi:hypothetical protein FRC06_006857 [Ceratobasidium sp. 370]|nr:hypothetical protein FRC06_006857 [Ceratobasidium sp. 370]
MIVPSVRTSAATAAEEPVDDLASVTDTDNRIKVEDADQAAPATPQERAGENDLEELLLKILGSISPVLHKKSRALKLSPAEDLGPRHIQPIAPIRL